MLSWTIMSSKYLQIIILCLFISVAAEAQIEVTPYSSQGLGNLVRPSLAHNMGMGGVGLAIGNGLNINNVNPALLYQNSLSAFDAAFSLEYKDMSKADEVVSGWNGGFAYGAFAFPIMRNRWSLGMGVSPYSQVRYSIEETRNINNNTETARLSQEGNGGLSRVHFSNGVRLFKGLSVGLRASYLFGAINEDLSIIPETGDNASLVTSYIDNIYYRGIVLEPAIHYSQKIGENTTINLGGIYQPETELNAIRNVNFENLDAGGQPISNDTIIFDENGNTVLPQKIGVGLALDEYLKYSIAFDFTMQQWGSFGTYRADTDNGNTSNDGMQDSYSLAFGSQYIPDISSVSSYLKRMTYRAGFRYQMTPFQVNDTQITDMAISLGLTLPMSNLSSLNLAIEAGIRGTTDSNLVRENYFRGTLGIAFNDQWFIRRKFN
jgi:hypothetical protein